MSTNPADRTNLRLKIVLDTLAEAAASGEAAMGGSAVLAQAITQLPLNDAESELLAGGVPRGHKSLTTATSKLVKAGWLVKKRGGWVLTDEGLRAAAAFPDAESLTDALQNGSPVPAVAAAAAKTSGSKSAVAPVEESKQAGGRKPRAKKTAAAAQAVAAAGTAAPAATEPAAPVETAAPAAAVDTAGQPEAVAIAGDFSTKLGAPENWQPHFDEVQMELDPSDRLWKLTAELPAGYYTYKVALDRSWEENYGAFGVRDGANHEFHHDGGALTFHYDHKTRDVSRV
ncbi:pullulanase X25 domain-containing protein [Crystallibacter degradans]|uniref:pullulanase X25 domain-containing protein n=1 Tax=Crystallibacter degradans TaxID=2726743 RepID=UPI001475C56F|nr:glycosidase [Arthrobacter sp. SF27]NMR28469.1 glycosidase [Arthrobacter sp. SF27]